MINSAMTAVATRQKWDVGAEGGWPEGNVQSPPMLFVPDPDSTCQDLPNPAQANPTSVVGPDADPELWTGSRIIVPDQDTGQHQNNSSPSSHRLAIWTISMETRYRPPPQWRNGPLIYMKREAKESMGQDWVISYGILSRLGELLETGAK